MLEFLTQAAGGGGQSLQGGTSGGTATGGDQRTSFTGGAKFSQVDSGLSGTLQYALIAAGVVLVLWFLMRKRRG